MRELMLMEIRQRELLEEAARIRLLREACRDGPPWPTAVSTASRQLKATLARSARQLEFLRWAGLRLQRRAMPR